MLINNFSTKILKKYLQFDITNDISNILLKLIINFNLVKSIRVIIWLNLYIQLIGFVWDFTSLIFFNTG